MAILADGLDVEAQQMLHGHDDFMDRMKELKSLRVALFEQKYLNFTLKEQLQRATKIQLKLEATLNEIDKQLQQQFDKAAMIRTQMHSKNDGEIGLSAASNLTAVKGSSLEHARQQCVERSDDEEIEEISSDEEQQHRANHFTLPCERAEHLGNSPSPRKQAKQNRTQETGASASSASESDEYSGHSVKGQQQNNHRDNSTKSDAETASVNHLVEDESSHPRTANPVKVHSTQIRSGTSRKNMRNGRGGAKTHCCSECGKTLSRNSSMKRHLRIHTGEKPFKCTDCGASFSVRSSLLRHQKIHSGKKTFKCTDCGAPFSVRSSLLRHQKVHSGKKTFKCTDCGAPFSVRSSLLRHQKIHSGEKTFKCTDCGAPFSDRSGLLRHQKIHSDEMPFTCDICKKKFRRKAGLLQHKHIHSGEKSHKCTACVKSFYRWSSLARHLKDHDKVDEFSYDKRKEMPIEEH